MGLPQLRFRVTSIRQLEPGNDTDPGKTLVGLQYAGWEGMNTFDGAGQEIYLTLPTSPELMSYYGKTITTGVLAEESPAR